ncbi:DUF1475 domain-containing protein [bacterium]|nr:DUF1475 domain-containing protein [bacterium]
MITTRRNVVITSAALGMGILILGSSWATSKLAIWDSFKKMWQDPWFKITMVDLYFGFIAVGAFIGYREKSVAKTTVWGILIAGLGNIASFLYLVLELRKLKTNEFFWRPKREKWRLF